MSTTSFECVNDFEWYLRCYFYIPVVVCPQHFLNVALLCCSLTCYVRIQVLYASNYVIWIPAFFGYMLRSCHHAHVVDSKMLLYINSNVSWGFDYIHKYFKIWNIEVGIEHMLYIHAILGFIRKSRNIRLNYWSRIRLPKHSPSYIIIMYSE